MTARRTIHDMTDQNVALQLRKVFMNATGPTSLDDWTRVAELARRLAGPDPRPIVALLKIAAEYSGSALQQSWHDQARAALDAWEKAK